MDRRLLLMATATWPLAARAHHGWSSFDVARPIYLEGKAVNVAWRNPHAELDLDVSADLKLPADLAQRALPAQAATVDGPGLLKAAQLPTRKDKRWHIELSPLSRLEAWKAVEIRGGDAISMLGFTFAGEKGDAILRVEYLWANGKVYGLRSSPA
jgi:Family of unknown function (DUF6152)